MEPKQIINAIIVVVAVVLGVFIGSKFNGDSEARRQREIEIKQLNIDITTLKKGLKEREVVIADGVVNARIKDSLLAVEAQRRLQAEKLFLRERKLRLEELKKLTDKEKEDIIIKRYQ